MGETSRLRLVADESRPGFSCGCRGDLVLAVPLNTSDGGVSISGEKAGSGAAPGGNEGSAFSTAAVGPFEPAVACRGAALAFFLRRAIRDS